MFSVKNNKINRKNIHKILKNYRTMKLTILQIMALLFLLGTAINYINY